MPITELAQTTNVYQDNILTIGPSQQLVSVQFFVSAPNSALYQLAKLDETGKAYWDPTENIANPGQGGFTNCRGIRFRTFGLNSTIVLATGYFKDDPVSTGSTPSLAVLTTSGSLNPGTLPNFTTGLFSVGPPALPNDGDIWIGDAVDTGNLATTSGTRWMFQYNTNSGSPYKWEYVGGSALRSVIAAQQGDASGGIWVSLGGPTVTLARTGDYELRYGASFTGNTAGATTLMSPSFGGSTPLNADEVAYIPGSANEFYTLAREQTKTNLGAGTVVELKYLETSGTSFWANRYLSVTPIRVS